MTLTPKKPVKKLPVMFRKLYDRDSKIGDLIAFFPTLPAASSNWYMVTCYTHVGQHGSASPELMRSGKPAKPEEFAELLNELRSIYEGDSSDPVELVVRSREDASYRVERERAWRAFRAIESAHDL